MFSGEDYVTFSSDLPGGELLKYVEDALEPLGEVHLNEQGNISIFLRSRYEGNLCSSRMEGSLRKRGDKYRLSLEYDSTLSTIGWVLFVFGILLYLLGLLVLFSPYSASKKIDKAVRRVLSELNPGQPLLSDSP